MSAYLTSNDTLSALVTYWAMRCGGDNGRSDLTRAIALAGVDRSTITTPRYNEATANAEALIAAHGGPERCAFMLLLAENQASLAARYPGDTDYRDGSGYTYQRLPIVAHWIMGRTTGHLVGMVRGYEYQSCEHADWERSPAWRICQTIRGYLLQDLERRDCGDGGNWASWENPGDPREIALAAALAGGAA